MSTTEPIGFPLFGARGLTRPGNKVILFIIVCVVPTILAALYYGVIAQPLFVTSVTFGVRPAEPTQAKSEGAGITQAVPFSSEVGITSYGVVQYLESDAFVHDLSARMNLDAVYGPQRGDVLDHLDASADTDQKLRYLRSKIRPYFDITTGLVTVDVKAFSADDSYALSRQVLEISESLINAISDRIRRDAVESANREAQRVSDDLDSKRRELAQLHVKYGIVEPSELALSNLQLASKLREDLITLQAQRDALMPDVASDAPLMKSLNGKIKVVTAELHTLDNSAGLGASARIYAPQVEQLENLKAQIRMLEKQYASVSDTRQRQIATAERQSLYLVKFVDALKPDSATQPHRLRLVLFAFVASFMGWAILVFGIQAVRDHLT
jgi:capsular polysaccharide transport system permease protein